MPVYNAAPYLAESTESILNQTYHDFEFIIVNDGSTDHSVSILDKYERADSRVRAYHQKNQGMIAALNFGCRLACGKYIARMDADDISLPTRLEKQLEYMEQRTDIGILGAWICGIDQNGSVRGTWRPPTDPKTLKWMLFFGVNVAHPSVLMRREIGEKLNYYRPDAIHGEDVDLWLRASRITEFGNFPEVLYDYRVWSGSTSQVDQQIRRETHVRLLVDYIQSILSHDPPVDAVAGLRQTRVGPPFDNLKQIQLTAALIQELHQNSLKQNDVNSEQRREISWDAAKRVASLALQAYRYDTWSSVALLTQAFKLDYRLLSPAALRTGLERAFQNYMPAS
jgi:GT2 family glycosyltransferase